MHEWIQGSDLLLPPWNLKEYQLLDLVKQGLQPHNSLKRPLEPIHLADKLTKAYDSPSGTPIGTHDMIIDPGSDPGSDPAKPVAVPGIDPAIAPAKPRKIRFVQRTIGQYLRDIEEVAGPDEIRKIMEELTGAIYREEEVRRFLGTNIPSLRTKDADGTRSGKEEAGPSDTDHSRKKVTRYQRHREEARRLAGKRWKKDKDQPQSLSEMVRYIQSLPRNPFDGREYKDKTITEWIRDLNPAYSQGRPGCKHKTAAE